jgi:hypothetical protein
MKKKKYVINQAPIKQVWLEENIILIKDVQIWVDQKMLKNTMKKKVFYNISNDQSWKIGQSKKWKGWKNLVSYVNWKL